jgi:hypothetical protein
MIKFLVFIISMNLCACSRLQTRAEALKVADMFLLKENPGSTKLNVKIVIKKNGWLITYIPFEGWAGGSCDLFVDRDTMQVVDRVCSQ